MGPMLAAWWVTDIAYATSLVGVWTLRAALAVLCRGPQYWAGAIGSMQSKVPALA